jgi:eukaryotic-like serine/threonine-protein kinase
VAVQSLTPERWKRLASILDEVLELDREQQAAFLDEACAGDTMMRVAAEALIAADASSGEFLGGSVESYIQALGAADTITPGAGERFRPGALIGPYRVEREIGHGGMGAVYLAERADGQFRQRVALKFVRRGSESDEMQRRFLTERQILARMNHDNIARVFDGGVTTDGRPWFAMEYVEGEQLTASCDARRLGIAERLRLFAQVVEAVRYAHQNLIVHRDLKPSNILVTANGHVKLLDFGIAKLLHAEDGESAGQARTRTELRILTPEFAAPEQVRGEPVTTATDVYALGAVLYELLTGHPAHRFSRLSPAEVERVVCETAPERPSAVVTRAVAADDKTTRSRDELSAARGLDPKSLRQRLKGDLDTIVLKALEKEPARRYASAEALAEDLRRYQAGLPILAQPDSRVYRARKFTLRHRVGVAASAALSLTIIAGLVLTIRQSRATAREAARAREVKDFVVGLFQVADPVQARGREITARELLTRGEAQVDSALGRQPEVQQELLAVLGGIHRELASYEQAEPLMRRAVNVARATYGTRHPEYASRLVDLATVWKALGRLAPAESLYRQALVIQRRALGSDDTTVALTLTHLAFAVDDQGRYAQAESLHRAALAIDLKQLGPDHLDVAADLDNLGQVLLDKVRNFEGADSALRAALAIRKKHLDPDHPHVVGSLQNIGQLLEVQGRVAEAESTGREVLAARRRIYPNGHPELAQTLHGLGGALRITGRYVESESLLVEALEMRRRIFGPAHETTMQSLNDLAITQYVQGRLAAAEQSFREVVRLWREVHGATHNYTLLASNNLGAVLSEEGKYAEAEALLRHAVRERIKQSGDTSEAAGYTLRNLGIVLHRTGRLDEAEQTLRHALRNYRLTLPAGHLRIAEALTALGAVLTDRGRPRAADSLLREALEIRQKQMGDAHLRTAETRQALGLALAALDRRQEAESLLMAANQVYAASPWAATQLNENRRRLRQFYLAWGKPNEAAKYRQ